MPPVSKKETPRVFSRPTYPLSEDNLAYLRDRFGFSGHLMNHHGIVETDDGDIIIPIRGHNGLIQGYEARSRRPGIPKALRYNGNDSDGMGWYDTCPDKEEVVLVEDLFSAIKMSNITNTIALLGTHLSPEQAGILAAGKWRRIYLALDEDATSVAVRLAKRYRALLPQLRVVPIHKDLKDMTYQQLYDWYKALPHYGE